MSVFISIFITSLLFITSCAQDIEQNNERTETQTPTSTTLVATVMPVGESDVSGSVTFSKATQGILIQGSFSGLEPGNHGFHIHQYGDCRAEDGTSAGGHFNPDGNDHGAPTDLERHMGDLGNLEANENGEANIEFMDSTVSLSQILGRGVIIHQGEDDLSSQPTGDAGGRIACGVIGIAQPAE